MRALFLVPGGPFDQLQVLPAAAAVAQQLGFSLQIACPPSGKEVWALLPAVEKLIPFSFDDANLADWANLLGSVREPDFQLCFNLASGRQVDLMLSMSHIPTRVAASGFSATNALAPLVDGWAAQSLEPWLHSVGVSLRAAEFRLSLPAEAIARASATLPSGDGPVLLLAPAGGPDAWPSERWQLLQGRIRDRLPSVRFLELGPPRPTDLARRAAQVASADVVLAGDPITMELALYCGLPLVALGRDPSTLPPRAEVKGLPLPPDGVDASDAILAALGLG
ncbi:MAG: glycosyltransferase family 9 protein [Synechococcaceae cyanobacterium]